MKDNRHDKDFLVVGVGTRLNRDDEIGLRLVEQLSLDSDLSLHCVLLEGQDAADVTSFILDTKKPLLVVDCADMGLSPGEHRAFFDSDARICVKTDSVSVHGMGLSEGIALARALGFERPVRVFAVQPFDLSPRPGLTPEMENRFGSLLVELRNGVRMMESRFCGNGGMT
jgi:hydrogenase maturation protease